MSDYSLVVVGGSWGGMAAFQQLLRALPPAVDLPIALTLHRAAQASGLVPLLQSATSLTVVEADDKQQIERGHVYVAPPDYHLLVDGGSFALSTEARVQFARPSIDVLFESAADSHGAGVIAIVLTGANADGARGLARVKAAGGVALVQEPEEADKRALPDAAIAATEPDAVLPVVGIARFVHRIALPAAAEIAAT